MLVTEKNCAEALEYIARFPERLVVDVETTGLNMWGEDLICGIAVRPGTRKGKSFYFPFRHEPGGNLSLTRLRQLIHVLSRPGLCITNWNTKFDIHFLCKDGMRMPDYAEDVMLAAHLMNENEPNFRLKELGTRYLGPSASKDEAELKDLMLSRGFTKGDLWRMWPHEVEPYACNDVDLTEVLREFYHSPLLEWGLWDLWREINLYMLATVRMEATGLLLDVPLIEQYQSEASTRIVPLQNQLRESAGYEINLNSPKQLQALLGLDSTAKEVLEDVLSLEDIPDIRALLEYRFWSKANSTYYNVYLERMDFNGVLRCSLLLHGTVTGRLSCREPNLQAVPRKTAIYKVKDVFIARPGMMLVSADYSQAELRYGSWLAKDEVMMGVLNAGGDIHQTSADLMYIERDAAKRINFGAFYGLGYKALAKKLRCSEERAKEFLTRYHGTFKNIKPLYAHMKGLAMVHDYIRLWTGRVRHFNGPHTYHNKALSNKVQGGVGEVMRVKITEMDSRFVLTERANMLLQVHDQVLFEVPDGDYDTVAEIAEVMTFRGFEGMPMPVDVSTGPSWGKLEKWPPKTLPSRPRPRIKPRSPGKSSSVRTISR